MRYSSNIDGVKQRVSHKLCDRDQEHYSTECKGVEELRDEQMVTTLKPKPQPTIENLITNYWEEEDMYWPR